MCVGKHLLGMKVVDDYRSFSIFVKSYFVNFVGQAVLLTLLVLNRTAPYLKRKLELTLSYWTVELSAQQAYFTVLSVKCWGASEEILFGHI